MFSPVRAPSSANNTVFTASTARAVALTSSSSGITARLSGMVSDRPAQEPSSSGRKSGSDASSTSCAS